MSTPKNKPDIGGSGGNVHPYVVPDQWSAAEAGMTMRQWYAGMALQGLIANDPYKFREHFQAAVFAFEMADAMIKMEAMPPEK